MIRLITSMLLMSLFLAVAGCGGGSSPRLVSITVTTQNATVPFGSGSQFTATGHYTDNSSADLTATATWSSSNSIVATISNSAGSKGQVTTVSGGSSTITAVFGGLSGSAVVNVVPVGGGIQGTPLSLAGAVTTISGSAAQFTRPVGMTTDGVSLYVADASGNVVRKVDLSSGTVTTLAGSGTQASSDGPGTTATFYNPDSITTDGTYLYVAESVPGLIRRIDKTSAAVTTLTAADGVTPLKLTSPSGITTDGVNLYVTDAGKNSIHKIVISTGVITTLAGSATDPPGSVNGTGLAARFNSPVGITTDGINLYVTDFGNNTIRQIVIASGVVTTLAGTPSPVGGSADGVGAAAQFRSPKGITTDGSFLYVTDNFNHTLRKIEISTGDVKTIAGSPGTPGTTDATGDAARFSHPEGVTSNGRSLFIADSDFHIIRKID